HAAQRTKVIRIRQLDGSPACCRARIGSEVAILELRSDGSRALLCSVKETEPFLKRASQKPGAVADLINGIRRRVDIETTARRFDDDVRRPAHRLTRRDAIGIEDGSPRIVKGGRVGAEHQIGSIRCVAGYGDLRYLGKRLRIVDGDGT